MRIEQVTEIVTPEWAAALLTVAVFPLVLRSFVTALLTGPTRGLLSLDGVASVAAAVMLAHSLGAFDGPGGFRFDRITATATSLPAAASDAAAKAAVGLRTVARALSG